MLLEAEGKCKGLIRFKYRAGSKGGKMKKREGESRWGMRGLYSLPASDREKLSERESKKRQANFLGGEREMIILNDRQLQGLDELR